MVKDVLEEHIPDFLLRGINVIVCPNGEFPADLSLRSVRATKNALPMQIVEVVSAKYQRVVE